MSKSQSRNRYILLHGFCSAITIERYVSTLAEVGHLAPKPLSYHVALLSSSDDSSGHKQTTSFLFFFSLSIFTSGPPHLRLGLFHAIFPRWAD